jgi:hypothetical protein
LPCRRSRVRVPSAASQKPRYGGAFSFLERLRIQPPANLVPQLRTTPRNRPKPSESGNTPEVEETIGPIAEKTGFVPNLARLFAITPRHFVGWWRYFDKLMRGASGLTQREMIAVVVFVEARCPY